MKPLAQYRKEQMLAELIWVRQEIFRSLAVLPAELHDQPILGEWSPKDLLAHLTGWDKANLAAAQRLPQRELPEFYRRYDPNWYSFKKQLVQEHKNGNLDGMVAAASASLWQLVEYVESLPPDELESDYGLHFGGYRVTIARLLEAEAKEEREHLEQLLLALDTIFEKRLAAAGCC